MFFRFGSRMGASFYLCGLTWAIPHTFFGWLGVGWVKRDHVRCIKTRKKALSLVQIFAQFEQLHFHKNLRWKLSRHFAIFIFKIDWLIDWSQLFSISSVLPQLLMRFKYWLSTAWLMIRIDTPMTFCEWAFACMKHLSSSKSSPHHFFMQSQYNQ